VRNNPENYVLFVIEKEMPKDVDESWAKAERSAKNVNIAFLSDSTTTPLNEVKSSGESALNKNF